MFCFVFLLNCFVCFVFFVFFVLNSGVPHTLQKMGQEALEVQIPLGKCTRRPACLILSFEIILAFSGNFLVIFREFSGNLPGIFR